MKRHVLAAVIGALGFGVAWGGWHLYVDHVNLHALINVVAAAQKQQQTPK